MTTQTHFADGADAGSRPDPLSGWLGAALALALAAVIVFAAFVVAQPVVLNQAANGLAQSAPSAAVQGVAGYLVAHTGAAPAQAAPGLAGAAGPAAGVCLAAQNVAPASGGPGAP